MVRNIGARMKSEMQCIQDEIDDRELSILRNARKIRELEADTKILRSSLQFWRMEMHIRERLERKQERELKRYAQIRDEKRH